METTKKGGQEASPHQPPLRILAGDGAEGIPSMANFQTFDFKLDSDSRVVFHAKGTGLAADQFRMLRRRLEGQFPNGAALLVTSATAGAGKTLNAANLAWCLAERNLPTLLLEMDFRRPAVSKLFGSSRPSGVESAFLGKIEPPKAVHVMAGSQLHVATVAQAQKEPVSLLKSPGAQRFLSWARSNFRWIVMDAPPVYPTPDVAELSSYVDAVLLVVRMRRTPRELLQKAVEMVGERLAGVILNDATLGSDSYYRYLVAYYSGSRDKEK